MSEQSKSYYAALPLWIKRVSPICSVDDGVYVLKALSIAIEALQEWNSPETTAGCPCGPMAKQALDKIAKLGESK